MDRSDIVIVTGFGPFRQYFVNPSWKAAQGLQMVGLGDGIRVDIKEIPVSYVKTQMIIAKLWSTVKPKFTVHLGISRGSTAISLEQTGRNSGYSDRDVCGFCPESHCCVPGGPEKLHSVINMRSLCKQLKQTGMDVIYSRDAGRYLCDFTYYCSLFHGEGRAALIHLPTSGSLSAPDTLVPLLQSLILTMLKQLHPQPP